MSVDLETEFRAALRAFAETADPVVTFTSRQVKVRRSRQRTIGLRVAIVAAAVVAVVGTDMVLAGQPWQASAEASPVVQRAVSAAAQEQDEPLRPGQYVYRKVVTTYPTVANASLISELWIPADPQAEWVSRITFVNGKGVRDSSVEKARDGRFDATTARDWYYPDTAFLQGLPTDPKALLNRLRADGFTDTRDQWNTLVDALMFAHAVPSAKIRSALLGALADLPGAKISDDDVHLGTRTGRSISITDWDFYRGREEIIFDPANGQVFGTRFGYGTWLGKAFGDSGDENLKVRSQAVVNAALVTP